MSKDRKLLVVVDMQNDFIDGALGSPRAVEILPAVKKLVQSWTGEVVYTKDTHTEDYALTQEGRLLPVAHCIKGSKGHDVAPGIYKDGAQVFEKNTFGSISLAQYAAEFDEVVLCGVCTDICVVSNALLIKAFAPESKVCVVADACAGTSVAAHEAALKTMRSCQVLPLFLESMLYD